MAIVDRHTAFYREIFALPGFLAEPFLMLGYQVIVGENLPDDFDYADMKQLLRAKGVTDVTAIDLFDERADRQYDLNSPVPAAEQERYKTVCDIGTLEHVFDTRQCMENCMRMVAPGGRYFLHTPVRGYQRHGLHTFNPELIVQAFRVNGFEVEYLRYSSRLGEPVDAADGAQNVLIWIVGRKTAPLDAFRIPQQGRYTEAP